MRRDLIIGSRLSNISEVRNFLDEIFSESDLDRTYFNRVFLGLSEAVNNSILHGNGLDENKSVFITVKYDMDFILLEICDEGDGFDFNEIEDPRKEHNLRKDRGRGIFLIRHYADEVIFFEEGRKVCIKFKLDK